MRKLIALLLAVGVVVGVIAAGAGAKDDAGVKMWRVTITNMSTGFQPFSPPLAAVHSNKADVWSVGEVASAGVAAIAEDAVRGPLAAALDGAPGVREVQQVAGGPFGPGHSTMFYVTSRGEENRLSLLTMLVNTNDAFTGLDSLHLKGQGGTYYAGAYDAGSEDNDQLAAHIPGPCCGDVGMNGTATNDPIAPHAGIFDGGALTTAVHGWIDPVAKIVIERV